MYNESAVKRTAQSRPKCPASIRNERFACVLFINNTQNGTSLR